jgi:hypothetical protein
VLDTKGITEGKPENVYFGSEIQAAVKAELNRMLSAPFFSQSLRCKRFLSHIVLQTLSGKSDQLKERMIGISVFDRANDYNTGEDAIVRVTANEVRKRIGQFYQESRAFHAVQIDLPRGSYVPEFKIRLAEQSTAKPALASGDDSVAESAAVEDPLPLPEAASLAAKSEETAGIQGATAHAETPQKHNSRRQWYSLSLALLTLGIAVFAMGLWRTRTQNTVPDVWGSFVSSKTPVLVCLGTQDISNAAATSSQETEDVVMRKDTIPIDDVSVVSSLARLLGNMGVRIRVAAADQTSLTDLQSQPDILIGSVDNQWTVRLAQTLRYRIAIDFPHGPEKPPVASITDSSQPAGPQWKIDFSIPLSEWKSDYAIVARYDDSTVGVPVLIEAGLGNDGSLAASRFVTSSDLAVALGREPSCKGKANFEAVIGTEIIEKRPGAPHILRLMCW